MHVRSRFGIRARILTAGAALLCAAVLGEVAVRVTGGAPGLRPISISADEETVYRRSTNPILSYELKPSYRNDDPDLQFSYPRTNAHGQRDEEREIDKPQGVRRVLLLGDSVVEGHRIREIDDLISRRLEQLYPDGGTEVLNFGVSGYCTLPEVELLQVKGLDFDPDLVVVLFVENDFNNFIPEAGKASAIDRPEIVNSLFRRSHLARLAFVRLDLFGLGVESDPVSWNRRAIGDNNVVIGLEQLAALSRRHGFDSLIAVWPRFEDAAVTDLNFVEEGLDELIVERLARSHGIPTVRLSEFFRDDVAARDPGVNPRLLYTVGDGLHPSVEGARVAALALKSALANGTVAPAPAGETIDVSEAVVAARAKGHKRPSYAMLHVNLGQSLEQDGNLEDALEQYELALEIEPRNVAATYNVGAIRSKQGRLDDAANAFAAALEIDSDYYRARKGLGAVFYLQGRLDDALAQLREALRLRPDDPEIHYNLGTVYLARNELDRAQLAFTKTLAIDAGHAAAHNSAGIVLARRGRIAEAAVEFERALALQPDFTDAARNLAQARTVAGSETP